MEVLRVIDAYCPRCQVVRRHDVMAHDPGRAICHKCAGQQPLMVPLESSEGTRTEEDVLTPGWSEQPWKQSKWGP